MKKILMFVSFSIIMLLMIPISASAEVRTTNYGKTHEKYGCIISYERWNGKEWMPVQQSSWTPNTVPVTYEVTYEYNEAYKMLDLLNEYRVASGVELLKSNDRLMQVAMERAAQANLVFVHNTPNDTGMMGCSMFIDSENLHWGSNKAEDSMESWKKSPGHNANMLDERWEYAGFGCVGNIAVQVFCDSDVDGNGNYKYYEVDGYPNKPIDLDVLSYGNLTNYTDNYTAQLSPNYWDIVIDALFCNKNNYLDVSERRECNVKVDDIIEYNVSVGVKNEISGVQIVRDSYTIISSNTDIIEVKNESLICKKAGIADVTISLKAYPSLKLTTTFQVSDIEVKNGTEVTVIDNTYKVIDVKKKTVSFIGSDKKKVVIPSTVKIQGKTYKVTTVAKDALKNNKTVTSVTIGKNVTKIEKNAFNGCSNLKKITVKTTKLKSVGKNAIKGIHKKATIKVPKSKLTKYKKLFKGKGQKKSVKITK